MSFPLVPQPKKRPALLDKRDDAAELRQEDKKQRAVCRMRSGGQCEVRTVYYMDGRPTKLMGRCVRRVSHNHHLLSGIGRRNKGRSLLAAHRLDVCDECHRDIHGHVLVPCVPQAQAERADSVRYERRSR